MKLELSKNELDIIKCCLVNEWMDHIDKYNNKLFTKYIETIISLIEKIENVEE